MNLYREIPCNHCGKLVTLNQDVETIYKNLSIKELAFYSGYMSSTSSMLEMNDNDEYLARFPNDPDALTHLKKELYSRKICVSCFQPVPRVIQYKHPYCKHCRQKYYGT